MLADILLGVNIGGFESMKQISSIYMTSYISFLVPALLFTGVSPIYLVFYIYSTFLSLIPIIVVLVALSMTPSSLCLLYILNLSLKFSQFLKTLSSDTTRFVQ